MKPEDDVLDAIAIGVFKAEARQQYDVAGLLRRCDEALRASRARIADLEQDARRLDWYILHNFPEAAGSHEQTANALRIERDMIDARIAGGG